MTTEINGTLRRTAPYDAHWALGARIGPFDGFKMPVPQPPMHLAMRADRAHSL